MTELPFYDRAGELISWRRYGALMEDAEYRRVASDPVVVDGEAVWVSTVWLGIDMRGFGGPPLIFETMVFGGAHDLESERYASEALARVGHERWVGVAAGWWPPDDDDEASLRQVPEAGG